MCIYIYNIYISYICVYIYIYIIYIYHIYVYIYIYIYYMYIYLVLFTGDVKERQSFSVESMLGDKIETLREVVLT